MFESSMLGLCGFSFHFSTRMSALTEVRRGIGGSGTRAMDSEELAWLELGNKPRSSFVV